MNELAQVVSQFGLDALLKHIHTVIVLMGSDGTLLAWNPAFDSIKTVLAKGEKFEEFVLTEDKPDFRLRLKMACEGNTYSRWASDLITDANGTRVSCDCLLLPTGDGRALLFAERIAVDPEISKIIDKLNRQVKLFRIETEQAKKIALRKQTEVEAVLAQAEEVSNIDALTFLPNRRQIIRELQDEVLRAQRYNSLFSISVVDLDHFKRINDAHGHAVGDRVLREVAIILRNSIRHPDLAGRYGGEEFLILLPNSPQEAASRQAERLCKQVRHSIIHADEHEIHMTISIGIAQFQYGLDTWQTLLNRADNAMYEAKNSGRDRWVVSKS